MVNNFFTQDEIPYDALQEYGLTKDMVEDLPEGIKQRLLSGKETPPLIFSVESGTDEIKDFAAKINLIRKEDGVVDILFHPQMETLDIDAFRGKAAEQLKQGKVIRTNDVYAQYDETIEQVITMPYILVRHNIEVLQDDMNLTTQQCRELTQGGVVEITRPVNGEEGVNEICSIGIDLNEDKSIRKSKGDSRQWEMEAKLNRIEKYNFGLFGCWVCDNKGCMSYFREEDYTEEIQEVFIRQNNINVNQQKLS